MALVTFLGVEVDNSVMSSRSEEELAGEHQGEDVQIDQEEREHEVHRWPTPDLSPLDFRSMSDKFGLQDMRRFAYDLSAGNFPAEFP